VPDVWSAGADLEPSQQERLAEVLETRGADPRQQELREVFLDGVEIPQGARALEVGCGTGVLTRRLAVRPEVRETVGVDVAPSLVERARALSSGVPGLEYLTADACALPFDEGAFDLVVFDSTLCHVPEPERAVEESFRVLRPGGVLAAFDGDYSTVTVALGEHDPLQTCVEAMVDRSVHDRWVMRRLPAVAASCGFAAGWYRSHGFVVTGGEYILSILDRGIDLLAADGLLGDESAAALRAEARRRVEAGSFFGHIGYLSLVARRPG